MTTTLAPDTDLAGMFGIEMDSGVNDAVAPAGVLCIKCHGRGNFIGFTGRVVGKCFACEGTGLRPSGRTSSPAWP